MLKLPVFAAALTALAACVLQGCASESHHTVATESVASHDTPYAGPRYTLAIGKFNNASPYMRGIFSEGTDQLGNQAKTILKTDLSQSGRFVLVDRDNMEEIAQESQIAGSEQKLTGAEVVITGEVTEFGRKVTGDTELFGILGKGKQQVAYSKVSINIVDVATSQVVHSVQGAGEYALSDREVIGFGSTSGYDSTLNGKVLNLSITDAVNKLVADLEKGRWSPTRKS
jgi:curli biogenesis system outer membrane secretion channel CsgG